MAERHNEVPSFRFDSVEIFRGDDNALGIGSYGAVYKARCDQLECAAKIIHPILFQNHDPAASRILDRFRQECLFVSGIRHPNIVQYLGGTIDPQSQQPVLLMELIDESLTKFLERSQQNIPYCIQVCLAHDIALALAYLHSNQIIHRDLSSNNVLILAGRKAKVTDFGMSRILGERVPRRRELTELPGTEVYMAPETYNNSDYDSKLDVFSLGVLLIQIMTRLFPSPTDRVVRLSPQLARFVPERERRMADIDRIEPTHPLLEIALNCINDNKLHRPTARDLCSQIDTLKTQEKYVQSRRSELEGRGMSGSNLVHLQRQLTRKDSEIADKEVELRDANEELRARDCTIAELRQQVVDFQSIVAEKDTQIEELRQQVGQLQAGSGPQADGSFSMIWEPRGHAPTPMVGGASGVRGDVAYIRPAGKKQIYTYNKTNREWSELVKSEYNDTSLAFIQNQLTTIGGKERNEDKCCLLTYTNHRSRKWLEQWPQMTHARSNPAVVCSQSNLVVAGGTVGHGATAAVEVLNLQNQHWHEVEDLPHPLSQATANISNKKIYLTGGWHHQGVESKLVFRCDLSDLVKGGRNRVWSTMAELPKASAGCTAVGRRLIAVGGHGTELGAPPSNNVFVYDPTSNEWEQAQHSLTSARSSCIVLNFGDEEVYIVGGYIRRREITNTIEASTISY